MKLIIAEKPQLGKIIADALGIEKAEKGFYKCRDGYTVTWLFGHILEYLMPDEVSEKYKVWRIEDLPFDFELTLKPKKNSINQYLIIKELLSSASCVINAGDPDDEGELLVREVLDYVGYEGDLKRLILNDLNVSSAKKALNNLKEGSDFDGYYHRALARSKADYIYGLNLSRLFTLRAQEKGYQDVFTVGRVQTPTLGLIVSRYLENKNHKEAYYYTVQAITSKNSNKQSASLISDKITDIEEAEKVLACKVKTLEVKKILIDQKTVKAPLPFSLLDLQAKVSTKHKIKVDKVLEITQSLREKYKAITYNRSDCNYLTSEQLEEAPKTVVFLTELLGVDDKNIDTSREMRAFNDSKVTAHTAIIPTFAEFKFDDLTAEEKIVYTEIANQYLAQFYPDKVYIQAIAELESETGFSFQLKANLLVDSGWEKILGNSDSDKESMNSEKYDFIKSLEEGEHIFCDDIEIKRNKTKPKPLYTEATLLKDLQSVSKYVKDEALKKLLREQDAESGSGERGGIGTPATRSAIIKNLNEKDFFKYEKNRLVPTEKGINFIAALPDIIVQPDMTAIWYEQQKKIGKGELKVDDFLKNVTDFVEKQVKKEDVLNLAMNGEPCECGEGRLILKKTKTGNEFFGCTNYPQCKISKGALNGELLPPCPVCSSALINTQKAISCTKDSEDCSFFLLKEISSKKLSEKNIKDILTKKETSLIKNFKSKAGKSFDAKLKVENGSVKFQFNNKRKENN